MEHTVTDSKGNVFFDAHYRADLGILHCEWIGFINDIEPAKKACLLMAELIKFYGCKLLLNDNRRQIGPWPAINSWLENTWKPALSAAGLKSFAHIHSENVFTQFTANKVLQKEFSHGIHFGHFENEEIAIAWLDEEFKHIS
jgi:hypothetical protein